MKQIQPDDRDTRIDARPAMLDDPTDHSVTQTTRELQWQRFPQSRQKSRRRSLICFLSSPRPRCDVKIEHLLGPNDHELRISHG